jgi:hypothetical protein
LWLKLEDEADQIKEEAEDGDADPPALRCVVVVRSDWFPRRFRGWFRGRFRRRCPGKAVRESGIGHPQRWGAEVAKIAVAVETVRNVGALERKLGRVPVDHVGAVGQGEVFAILAQLEIGVERITCRGPVLLGTPNDEVSPGGDRGGGGQGPFGQRRRVVGQEKAVQTSGSRGVVVDLQPVGKGAVLVGRRRGVLREELGDDQRRRRNWRLGGQQQVVTAAGQEQLQNRPSKATSSSSSCSCCYDNLCSRCSSG